MYKQSQFLGSTPQGIFCQALFGSSGVFEKTAGAPPFSEWETGDELRKFLSTITRKDRERYCYVLVNALGAGEYFGSNINADYFPWNALCHEGDDYGYKTFLTAHAFQHHKNKDPARAFGIPVLSILNHRMKRVELVVRLDREKAKLEGADGIITRIDQGEFPDVSMGCFPAGTLVTMADGTRKPIEEIQIGDFVITHRGRVRKVTELHRRKYTGSLYSVRAEAHPVVRSTRQHPWSFVNEDEVKFKDDHANLRWKDDVQLQDERWIHAECLDDQPAYLLEPVFQRDDSVTPYVVQPTRAAARLLGYYLAEGHLLRDKKGELSGIELTTHVDDTVHEEIEHLCREFGTTNVPAPFERVNSEVARGIWIFDRRLAEFCQRHAGQYSLEKRLSRDVLSWHPDLQRELLGAYANGDGCGSADGSLGLSTSSVSLAYQWLLVLPRLGIIPSLGVLEHKPSTGKATTDTTEYVVHIGKQWAQKLRDVTSKVQRVEIEKTKLSRKILDGKIVTPIREIDSIYVEMDVFNFEVEEDNSYLVEGLAVHNCKVPYDVCAKCGHKSKTREDYCVHMSPPPELRHIYGPNKILPDGLKICVINLHPRFFDISFVFIGADKTAKVMAKLASRGSMLCMGSICAASQSTGYEVSSGGLFVPEGTEKTAAVSACDDGILEGAFCRPEEQEKTAAVGCGQKKPKKKVAEILKEIPAGVFAMKRLPVLESQEPDLPDDLLEEAAEHRLPKALGALSSMGMILKPHEYARMVLKRMGEDRLSDELEAGNHTFRPVHDFADSPIDMDGVVGAIQELLRHLSPDSIKARTVFGEPFAVRVRIVVRPKIPLPTRTPIEHPLLDKISAAYNGYRRDLLMKLGQATELVQRDSKLREMVLGEGLATMFSKTASAPVLSLDSVAYMMSAYMMNRSLLSTTAGAVCNESLLSEELLAQGF